MSKKDIRKKVLSFAEKAIGRRIWARTRRFTVKKSKRTFLPLVNDYKWNGTVYSCVGSTSEQERWANSTVILTDRTRRNDFVGRDREKRRACSYGVGECWDLAYVALQENKGLGNSTYTKNERKWSNSTINNLSGVKGGEILEIKPTTYFFKFSYKENMDTIVGIGPSSNSQIGPDSPHTAIVKNAIASKGIVNVLEQNTSDANGNRILSVHNGEYSLMNKIYQEGGYIVLQIVGGSKVKALNRTFNQVYNITNSNNFSDKNIQNKWNDFIRNAKKYINNNSQLPNSIKVYIPYSM